VKNFLCKAICVMLLGAMSLPASADKADLTQYRYIPVEAMESALLYELKPLASTYIDAGKLYGVDPVFLAAKDAEESGWGRYQAAPNNLGGWTNSDGGYMEFESPEEYIYHTAKSISEMYLDEDGCYHYGTSLSDVNTKYNGSQIWVEHIGSIMDDINQRINEYTGSDYME
jgi:beta-N-acetylglucosaminidase